MVKISDITFEGPVDYGKALLELIDCPKIVSRVIGLPRRKYPVFGEGTRDVKIHGRPVGELLNVDGISQRFNGESPADPVAVIQLCILHGQASLEDGHMILTFFRGLDGQLYSLKLSGVEENSGLKGWRCQIEQAGQTKFGPKWLIALVDERPARLNRPVPQDPQLNVVSGGQKRRRHGFVR